MKNKKKRNWLLYFFYMLIGAICGILSINYDEKLFGGNITISEKILFGLILMLFVVYAMLIQVIIHETGHLIFGLKTGYKFVSFRIGSMMFIRKEGRIRCVRYSLKGTGGQCLMAPPDKYTPDMPFVLYNLGGCILNIAASIISVFLCILTDSLPGLSMFFLMLAVMGFASALMNGIPMRLYMVNNDGYNTFEIKKDEAAKRCFWIQLRVNELIYKGILLKNMPAEWFDMPDSKELNNSMCASVGVLACNRAMEVMDFEKAANIADELLWNAGGLVGIHRYMLTADMIYCELIGDNRADVIKRMYNKDFKKFAKASSKKLYIIRMMYAYELFLNNNEQAAEKQLEEFKKTVRVFTYKQELKSERELIEYAGDLYQKKTKQNNCTVG